MYAGIDFALPSKSAPGLEKHSALIQSCMALDKRGAYFNHDRLVDGFKLLIDADQIRNVPRKDTVKMWASKSGQNLTEVMHLFAFKIRVMLAHSRSESSSSSVAQSRNESSVAPAHSKKKARVHPFLYFHEEIGHSEDEDEEEDAEEEQAIVISRFYDSQKATQTFSDGRTSHAITYGKGDDGFIVATFSDHSKLQLDVPNVLYDENTGGILQTAAPKAAPAAAPKAAPAAAPKARRRGKGKGKAKGKATSKAANPKAAREAAAALAAVPASPEEDTKPRTFLAGVTC